MPKIDMLPFGTAGVDMRTHPHLLPDKKKLRSAVNLRFEEGVIRTRFGFRYQPLTEPGQFQGACLFQPAKGISSGIFSTTSEGIAIVSGGDVWFRCSRLALGPFCNKGAVHLYQAENYLVIQNPSTSTFWWDGVTLTESPGMQEVDFNDPETPWVDLSDETPVGDPNICEPEGDGEGEGECRTTLQFTIQDAETQDPVQAHLEVRVNAGIFFEGTVGVNGVQIFETNVHTGRANDWIVTAEGYLDKSGSITPVECQGNVVFVQLERPPVPDCTLVVSEVFLIHPPSEDPCALSWESDPLPVGGDVTDTASVTVTNIGTGAVVLTEMIQPFTEEVYETVPALPVTLEPGYSVTITATTPDADIRGAPYSIANDCGDPITGDFAFE